jgi:hypothetical protein
LLNTCQRIQRDIKLYLEKAEIIFRIQDAILQQKKVVICTNSIAYAKQAHKSISNIFPTLSIKCYHSESDRAQMSKDLQTPNTNMLADVLIYSPTITAGVSIEVKHYDEIFCFFTDKSCNAYIAAQMIGRVRHINSNKLHLFLDSRS